MRGADGHMLPGGFVPKNSDVDDAAVEVLKQRTGLKNIFLKQFHLFGNIDRAPANHAEKLVDRGLLSADSKTWFDQRFVTVGYYALVEYSKVSEPTPDPLSESCDWYAIDQLPSFFLDHKEIVEKALENLKRELNTQPIGLNLLALEFTMTELQALYETILGKKLDRRNFRRKILSYDILVDTGKRRTGGAHKAPILYRFDKDKYQKANRSGLTGGW